MRCPFLREAQVKWCCASPFRTMIVRPATVANDERCSGKDWLACPVAKQHCEERPTVDRCPFLQESLVQYCSSTPHPKYIPYSEGSLSRCANERHRYCEVFLSAEDPGFEGHPDSGAHAFGQSMSYAPNHLWLDTHVDGTCHIGIDSFLAGVLQRVETLSFVTSKGTCYPTVVCSVRGVDLQLTFPARMELTGTHTHLRSRLTDLVEHPYTLGWLFEGKECQDGSDRNLRRPNCEFIAGIDAKKWMAAESKRLTEFVNTHILATRHEGLPTMADGGEFSSDLLSHLTREEILQLFLGFFTLPTSRYPDSVSSAGM